MIDKSNFTRCRCPRQSDWNGFSTDRRIDEDRACTSGWGTWKGRLEVIKGTREERATFVIEHLGGKARQAILGRGSGTCCSPEAIFSVLQKTFGDGDKLPLIQQRFYSFQQGSRDLISCSLELVSLYDRMSDFDSSTLKARRDLALKERLAEAVGDRLLRDPRRLNIENGNLNYFELGDRAIQWLGSKPTTRDPIRAEAVRCPTTPSMDNFKPDVVMLI